jgi:cytochrome c oxidase assembly factor CtaG
MRSLLPLHWHIFELLVIVAAGIAHSIAVPSTRQRCQAIGALIALAAVTMWPVGDLAATVSLSVATVQRLVIMLLVAPLLLLSTPTAVFARVTSPRFVDPWTRRLAHPGMAIVVVTVIGTLTLAVPIVNLGARSMVARDVTLAVVLATGFILWVPALGLMPGARRLSPTARAGYVFASALVVTSLSVVWIFARHPLYSGLQHQHALLHISALTDQQIAGFVAKLGCYIPMGIVAFRMFFHADDERAPAEETPLYWADVERQLLRVDRQRDRALRRHRPQ